MTDKKNHPVHVLINTESRFPIDRGSIRDTVQKTILDHQVKSVVEVEILIVGNRKMQALNKKYRSLDATTDVLSFPLEDPTTSVSFVPLADGVLRLGSVVVSYPEAVREAGTENKMVDEKISSLVAHGILHLLGIHHE